MSFLKVLKPGMLTTIQDWGRYGQRQNGLSTGGPIDEHAFLWANHLLGNPANCTTLEITVGLAVFEARCPMMIAICGAQMQASINNTPIANWSSHRLQTGDKLTFGSAKQGLRSYLAVQSGFKIEKTFASSATVIRESLGGLNGQALATGDELTIDSQTLSPTRQVPHSYLPIYQSSVQLEFIPAYQFNRFDEEQQRKFTTQTFTLSQRMDRMGCQLTGANIDYQGPGIISEGVALGSIQVPADGQPIVLLKDAGSIGGYPKLGCVTRLSLNKLAQCKPQDQVRFSKIDAQTATEKLRRMYQFFGF